MSFVVSLFLPSFVVTENPAVTNAINAASPLSLYLANASSTSEERRIIVPTLDLRNPFVHFWQFPLLHHLPFAFVALLPLIFALAVRRSFHVCPMQHPICQNHHLRIRHRR